MHIYKGKLSCTTCCNVTAKASVPSPPSNGPQQTVTRMEITHPSVKCKEVWHPREAFRETLKKTQIEQSCEVVFY